MHSQASLGTSTEFPRPFESVPGRCGVETFPLCLERARDVWYQMMGLRNGCCARCRPVSGTRGNTVVRQRRLAASSATSPACACCGEQRRVKPDHLQELSVLRAHGRRNHVRRLPGRRVQKPVASSPLAYESQHAWSTET